MKQCTKCKECKDESEFCKDRTKKDGLNGICRECTSEYGKRYRYENKSILSKKSSRYYIKHKIELSRKNKINREKNKNDISIQKKEYGSLLSIYNTYFSKLSSHEECRRDPNNEDLLQVKCKNCNEWFNPSNIQIKSRIACINFRRKGNSYLFCSINCKDKFNYKLTDNELTEYKKYKYLSTRYMNKTYKSFKWKINPMDLPRKRNNYSIDHIFSVLDGFKNKVHPEVLNNPFNLRMLQEKENIIKLDTSYITIGELYEDYNISKELLNYAKNTSK